MMRSLLSASWLCSLFQIYVVAVWLSILYTKSNLAQDGVTITYEREKQAFCDVMGVLNHHWDWKTLLPDPYGVNAIKGIDCDLEGNTFYFTDLNFGPTYDNTPTCSFNATIHPSILLRLLCKLLNMNNSFAGSRVCNHR
ncbi:hypothetical protein O6H91_15G079200 [Diphasiastrum complanatum]|uniref:Uncharacterized protein n=1 Tax=Diphasiastrum complanatum TaxID=34168 RepID=A0ACC2BJZ6_DIPCM|nr:hypothetical protein O6H91_15G079200 [Diphasiastrum complanatum]